MSGIFFSCYLGPAFLFSLYLVLPFFTSLSWVCLPTAHPALLTPPQFAPVLSQVPIAFVSLLYFFTFSSSLCFEVKSGVHFLDLVYIRISGPTQDLLWVRDFSHVEDPLVALSCFLRFGRVVISLTYSPFPFLFIIFLLETPVCLFFTLKTPVLPLFQISF